LYIAFIELNFPKNSNGVDTLNNKIRKQKITRIKLGGTPRVLDLFSGCGGISLGFHSAGYQIIGAIEFDKRAAESHAFNFHNCSQDLHQSTRDITKLDPDELIRELGINENVECAVDVIIGGPPCQAYSRIGRAKLREVRDHPEASLNDPRGNLYLRYLEYVRQLQPIALLMENVPDMLDFGGQNIANEVCESLSEMGYECKYTLLNSAFYGIPQMRERLFLIAYTKELGKVPVFPSPTHWIDLPTGYKTTRRVAQRNIAAANLIKEQQFFVSPPEPTSNLPLAVTAKDALADLPQVRIHLEGKLKKGIRRFDQLLKYSKNKDLSQYASLMRNWPGFENSKGVYDHVLRYLPRDYAIFARMNPGDEYPEAYRHAWNIFEEKLSILEESGMKIEVDSEEYKALKKSTVPPYDPNKFANKWRKMEADRPARTLMAHLGRDGYSHIHYDSSQARTITPREAARLQSFPDGFIFKGSMDAAFKQIGNAVPPLLAHTLAVEMAKAIGIKQCTPIFQGGGALEYEFS